MSYTGIFTTLKDGDKTLKLVYAITCTGECTVISEEFSVDFTVILRFQFSAKICNDTGMEVTFSYALAKDIGNEENLKINIACEELNFAETDVSITTVWTSWKRMGSIKPVLARGSRYCTQVQFLIILYEIETKAMSSKLYDDNEFTDFYLCAGEDKIAVHKSFLVAHSDVFKAMLRGPWKEAAEGKVNMEGVTIKVLERLKNYMYNGDVNYDDDEVLRTLLLLARYYLIEDLQKQCIRLLAENVKPEKLFSLIEFACQHQIPELPFAILQMTRDSVVSEAFR